MLDKMQTHLRGCLYRLVGGIAKRTVVVAVAGGMAMQQLRRADYQQQRNACRSEQEKSRPSAATHWLSHRHYLKYSPMPQWQ
jgi:hypothetical protein